MFTGIIEAKGLIEHIRRKGNSMNLSVKCGNEFNADIKTGDSIAIDGMCLTVEKIQADKLYFTALDTSAKKTILQYYRHGTEVNLEKALTLSSRMGGHSVNGHVDTIGEIIKAARHSERLSVEILIDAKNAKYLVENDSIAVNGISLTVKSVTGQRFLLDIIPQTVSMTNLSRIKPGMKVNIEINSSTKSIYEFTKRRT